MSSRYPMKSLRAHFDVDWLEGGADRIEDLSILAVLSTATSQETLTMNGNVLRLVTCRIQFHLLSLMYILIPKGSKQH